LIGVEVAPQRGERASVLGDAALVVVVLIASGVVVVLFGGLLFYAIFQAP
jgi:hypothetical protein